jgi:hypothetical protein
MEERPGCCVQQRRRTGAVFDGAVERGWAIDRPTSTERPQHIPEKGFAPRGRDNSPHEEGALNDMLVPPPQIPLKEGEEVC